MSLYDVVVGRRPYWAIMANALVGHPEEFDSLPRVRDIYFNANGEIEILSKTGPQAHEGRELNFKYERIPGYLGMEAASQDSVYAYWRYAIPANYEIALKAVYKKVGPFSPIETMQRIIKDMHADRNTPETRRAWEHSKPLIKRINNLVRSGKPGVIKIDDEH